MEINNKMLLQLIFFVFVNVIVLPQNTGCALLKVKESYTISRMQAWTIVKQEIIGGNIKNRIVYVSVKPLKAGQKIKTWKETYTVPKNFQSVWLFFVDDQPDANWEHDCRYIFLNAGNGKYKVIKALVPPISMDNMKKIFP